MKRFLSVILSVALIFSCVAVGFSAFAQDTTTKFAVASDLHYVVPEEELEMINSISDKKEWFLLYKDIINRYSYILDIPETIYD